ncbi:MAG: glycoside hydrolase family 9 protein, partial [Candidatus Pelagibacter ubique]
MKKIIALLVVFSMMLTLLVAPAYAAGSIDYGQVLQQAIYFYECQQAGPLPDWNRVQWRDDATMNDYVQGGWYDAGDHVKFNLPMSYTAAMLGWALYEYGDGFDAVGQKDEMENNLRFVLDYLVDCDKGDSYVYQVGDGNDDHCWWGPVELIEKEMERPYFETDEASACIAESAAALAIGSIVLDDSTYLQHAESLFELADTKRSDDGYTAASGFYNSWSGFYDELMWASTWLYVATNDSSYLTKAEGYYPYLGTEPQTTTVAYKWAHCWDDVHNGALLMLAKLTDNPQYHEDTQRWLDYWTVGYNGEQVAYTSGGLAWMSQWGSLRYATTTAFLASVYADSITDATLKDRYNSFAKTQIDYALGDNPQDFSYVVGLTDNSPEHPHHRTSQGSWIDNMNTPETARHILYGALVGGPDSAVDGSYEDTVSDYICNEVACDYNAGFVGILAKMCDLYGGTTSSNFPVPEIPEDEFFVEASINQASSTYSEYKLLMNNRSGWPARTIKNLSMKLFLDLSEAIDAGYSADDITVSTNYVEFPVTLSPVTQYQDDIYYV